IYETPGGTLLYTAHRELEQIALTGLFVLAVTRLLRAFRGGS
ncbi:hypothetical protein QML35_25910, partial [Klebsiella pneumoniae]